MIHIRHACHPRDVKRYTTEELRENFLATDLFQKDAFQIYYTHYDRVIFGGVVPAEKVLPVEIPETKTAYFLERREMAFVNIGKGQAKITVEGTDYQLNHKDVLYIGRGNREILVSSVDPENPAKLYFVSTTAHASYPVQKMDLSQATPRHLGSKENCNERTINQCIHQGGIQSCQLMLGITKLEVGSTWNTYPSHLHDRRMEVYLYFDMEEEDRVFHMMGEPTETRHIVMKNEEAVISPNWSIHTGVGTSNYTFIWAMGGENYTFDDQDVIPADGLR